jgi:hypothetical protein
MIECKTPEERIELMQQMIMSDCPTIVQILNRWEDRGVYCVGIENHRNTECAQCAPKSIDLAFFPSLHVCKLAMDLMHFIKLVAYEKSVYVIPLIKTEMNGEISLIPESINENIDG